MVDYFRTGWNSECKATTIRKTDDISDVTESDIRGIGTGQRLIYRADDNDGGSRLPRFQLFGVVCSVPTHGMYV